MAGRSERAAPAGPTARTTSRFASYLWQHAAVVPADSMTSLCGYRSGGNPNTSDNSVPCRKSWVAQLFDILGIPHDEAGPGDSGSALERHVAVDLAQLRPDYDELLEEVARLPAPRSDV